MDHPLLPHLSGYRAGRFLPAGAGPTFDVHDPATGAVLATLPEYGREETAAAIDAAEAARGASFPTAAREQALLVLAQLLAEERDGLAAIITAENGKPLAEARGEVDYAAGFFRDAVRHLPALAPVELVARPKGLRWVVHHRPAGVAGLITPWNFPVAMLAKKLAGALAAGTPSVVKPAELTPLSCIALFTLLDRLDLPAGMVNLVFGRAPEIGLELCERPEVRVISFTGSTGVGKLLAAQCAPGIKRLSLELGGNAPFVVFDDADLDRAAKELMSNKFRCSGQTCVCTNRVLVQAPVAEAFAGKITGLVAGLEVGPGAFPNVTIGPLIDRRGFDKVQSLVADALARGARAAVGGPASEPSGGGCFFPPTVLVDVTAEMACSRDEVFGPVVAISTFDDEADAVRRANDTPYGLAAYVFTADPARAQRVAARLHFGHVGLNTASGPTPEAPFGGMGLSGIGREGGLEGVLEFIELQTTPIAD
jgi:succinate-semialdehyde dehydrogenase/glutarate-semialdehyde dehydrogenase